MYGEEFHEDAYGDEPSSESDLSEEEDIDIFQKPDSRRLKIYKNATPFVIKLFSDPQDESSEKEIDKFNKEIYALNQEDKIKGKKTFSILTQALKAISSGYATTITNLETNPEDETSLKKLLDLHE
ncbi:hypothetical protein AYL99_12026 [Fonsecaea erecta]|uniref:Uncharacterized protein n=1 Tax=Fonsecaea erecta TaxID=1367422 RepID=A0A178Z1T9_9EURO|nr:hypothetical protein AYL99_12026 [Fonsecaea erecta]OAP53770.1 hypothetical protein AYL99_12026 [Fonsecaea erecta]